MSTPANVKELERYIGMIAFHSRFMVDHSNTVAPLRAVLSDHKGKGKNSRNLALSAGTKCHVAHCCKIVNEALADCIALSHYNPNLPLHVYTDASNHSIGAALVQKDHNGSTFIVDVWNKHLDGHASSMSIFKKELLAIRSALFRWRKFLMYNHFTVMVDNRSLVKHLIGSVQANGVLEERMVDEINEYAPSFHYINIEGKDNPDVISL